jgi:FlgD Ig-like domain
MVRTYRFANCWHILAALVTLSVTIFFGDPVLAQDGWSTCGDYYPRDGDCILDNYVDLHVHDFSVVVSGECSVCYDDYDSWVLYWEPAPTGCGSRTQMRTIPLGRDVDIQFRYEYNNLDPYYCTFNWVHFSYRLPGGSWIAIDPATTPAASGCYGYLDYYTLDLPTATFPAGTVELRAEMSINGVVCSENTFRQTLYVEAPCAPCVQPGAAYQSIFLDGNDMVIELRNEILPQAVNLAFNLSEGCVCPDEAITGGRLVPRSGTGPVIEARGVGSPFSAYFLIDNYMAPGYYDLEVDCSGGSRSTILANVNYVGFRGYTPEARLYNSVTGNTIRGADISLWRHNGSGYDLYRTTNAGDGTYSFGDLPDGTYQVLVQYELGGEQTLGPYTVGAGLKASLPDTTLYLDPITDDVVAPNITFLPVTGGLEGLVVDDGVGLAVVEVLPDSLGHVQGYVDPFTVGVDSVRFYAELVDGYGIGSATLRCIDQLGNIAETILEIDEISAVDIPELKERDLMVSQYPNPFNPRSVIRLDLRRAWTVDVDVFDASGRRVRALVRNQYLTIGSHEFDWDGRDDGGKLAASGSYFYQVKAGAEVVSGRMVLLK